ncbi:hypothetical protein [Streptomyces sp. NPDC091215]|uniref:hypothetical protein n=1 Tax=Streptomyces sp. NPDC091215 TaxID=3155192 RepID=UPI003436B4A1
MAGTEITLHTRPENGAYRDVLPGKYGEAVPLPEPLGIDVATDGFPVYGEARGPQGRFTEKTQ